MKTLGERIRELREAKDLSLRELAERLDVSAAFLSDIELGRRHPSEKVLVKLAAQLGTTPDDLRTFDTRPPVEEMKRRAAASPQYGMALRKMVDKDVNPQKLLDWVNKQKEPKKKKDE